MGAPRCCSFHFTVTGCLLNAFTAEQYIHLLKTTCSLLIFFLNILDLTLYYTLTLCVHKRPGLMFHRSWWERMNKEEPKFLSDSLGKHAKPCSSPVIDLSADRYRSTAEIQTNDFKFLKTKVQAITLLSNYCLHCWMRIKPHSQ